jgi:hypothetical protein
MYKVDSETKGKLEQVYLKAEALPTVSMSSDDDSDSTEGADGKYISTHNSNVDMSMADDVDAPYGGDLDSDVEMAWDGENQAVEHEQEDDDQDEREKEEDE